MIQPHAMAFCKQKRIPNDDMKSNCGFIICLNCDDKKIWQMIHDEQWECYRQWTQRIWWTTVTTNNKKTRMNGRYTYNSCICITCAREILKCLQLHREIIVQRWSIACTSFILKDNTDRSQTIDIELILNLKWTNQNKKKKQNLQLWGDNIEIKNKSSK